MDVETHTDVCDRALFYYRLLHTDVEQAKKVVQRSTTTTTPYTTTTFTQRPLLTCDDFRVKEFNTLSVVYDAPSTTFITSKLHNNSYTTTPPGHGVREEEGKSVVVGNLLDVLEDNSSSGDVCGVVLMKDFVMEKDSFQTSWKSMQHVRKYEEKLNTIPEHGEILELMEGAYISMMACSRPEDLQKWRFFFYGRLLSSESVMLVELTVLHLERSMCVVIKTDQGEELDGFCEFYKSLFVGR